MQAILRDRIFIEVNKILREHIIKKLTYTIPMKVGAIEVRYVKLYDYKIINDKTLSIPIGRTDLIPSTHDIIDKRTYNMTDFHLREGIVLRDSQKAIYDSCEDNCIINAGCSFGKTFTGLALIEKLGQKTIVIVHTKKLQDQWVEETKKVLGITPGIIGGGLFETDNDLIIATKQTLDKRANTKLYNDFGTVIIDECLDYDTKIDTKEKGGVRIGTIVNQKLEYHVNSWNGKDFEWKKITNWFKNKEEEYMIKFTFNNRTTLTCTLNHQIYDQNGIKKPAELFLEDDYMMSDNIVNTSKYVKNNIDILLGCIIGDGCLQERNNSIRLSIGHGLEQEDYLKYKFNILKNICNAGIKQDIHKAHGNFKETVTKNFSTLQFVDILNLNNGLYSESCGYKNKITKDICNMLTIESWSLIYMDDGSIDKDKGFIKFHIYMDTEYLELLKESLVCLFDIEPSIHIRKGIGSFLYLKVNCAKKFIHDIEHLIHPCLSYKKGMYNTNKAFKPIKPIKGFENYTLVQIKDIDFKKPKNNFRYNITVKDNHNYTASGKLVANCHHIPAKTFNNILDKFRARYKIGLSATLKRKDMKEFLITNYLTKTNIFKPKVENSMKPSVVAIRSGILLPGATSWQGRVTKLLENSDYYNLIIDLVHNQVDKGHKVLVIANRVEFLKNMHNTIYNSALVIGGSDDTNDVIKAVYDNLITTILGSAQVMSEGISINPLSCLILATPINSDILLEQVIGRVIREYENKMSPVIFDIILKGQTGSNQWRTRKQHYIKMGYEIDEIIL